MADSLVDQVRNVKRQHQALGKRGVRLRTIKRYHEGPFLELPLNTKEEYASTDGESPHRGWGGGGGRPYDYL